MLASTHHSCNMKSVSRHSEMAQWEANLPWSRTTAPLKSPLPICVILFPSYFSLCTAHYLVEHLFYVYVYCLSLDREVHSVWALFCFLL